jgi:hypothetical protein
MYDLFCLDISAGVCVKAVLGPGEMLLMQPRAGSGSELSCYLFATFNLAKQRTYSNSLSNTIGINTCLCHLLLLLLQLLMYLTLFHFSVAPDNCFLIGQHSDLLVPNCSWE